MNRTARVIRIIGSIDEDAFRKFSAQLLELELANSKASITIELSSGGGTATDALAIVGRIRSSPCYKFINIEAYGLIASAAVMILAVCHLRSMSEEAWVMVHEDSGKIKGDVQTFEREAAHYRRMEDQWADLMAKYSTTSAEKWSNMHKATTYLTAKECLRLGLVDKII